MRGLALLVCLAALVAIGGCGDDGDDKNETLATVTDTSTTAEQPDSEGGNGDKPDRDKPDEAQGSDVDVAKLSAELDQIGAQTGAQVGAAIGPPGAPPIVLGSLTTGSAWSTIKVPIALQVIDEAGGVEGLTPEQSANITAAITLSDNEAAAALFQDLVDSHGSVEAASQVVTELLRKAGDDETVVSTQGRDGFSTYGQTEWSLEAQTVFMGALLNGCIGEQSGRDFVLAQMSQVTSDTWGLGSAGTAALWKGGWGPGPDGPYLARQMGQLEIGGGNYAVAIAAIANDGSFESAQAADTQIAEWLVDNAPTGGSPGNC